MSEQLNRVDAKLNRCQNGDKKFSCYWCTRYAGNQQCTMPLSSTKLPLLVVQRSDERQQSVERVIEAFRASPFDCQGEMWGRMQSPKTSSMRDVPQAPWHSSSAAASAGTRGRRRSRAPGHSKKQAKEKTKGVTDAASCCCGARRRLETHAERANGERGGAGGGDGDTL